jgi:GNAT superfamily N-acetyltransferase
VAIALRPARTADAATLRELERDAGQRFREVGLGFVADDEPPSVEVLRGYAEAERGWVAVDSAAVLIGCLLVDVVDGAAHIEQVSVATAQQGRGAGRMLIEQARRWAGANSLTGVTLTTFSHVPWNRPLYEHLGLRRLMEREAAHGLDPGIRVAMTAGPLAYEPTRFASC